MNLLENQIQGPYSYHDWCRNQYYFEESVHCFLAWHVLNRHDVDYSWGMKDK